MQRDVLSCVCPDCGQRFRVPSSAKCEGVKCHCSRGTKRNPFTCRHIGPPFDATITAKNCGCSSAQAQLTVFACEVHGECLPTYKRGDLSEAVKVCLGCDRYEKK